MSIQHIEKGLSSEEVRNEVIRAIKHNNIHQAEVEELFCIFFDDCDVWAERSHLIDRISTCYDRGRLEEAARVVINPMIYYVQGDGKYYVYGG